VKIQILILVVFTSRRNCSIEIPQQSHIVDSDIIEDPHESSNSLWLDFDWPRDFQPSLERDNLSEDEVWSGKTMIMSIDQQINSSLCIASSSSNFEFYRSIYL